MSALPPRVFAHWIPSQDSFDVELAAWNDGLQPSDETARAVSCFEAVLVFVAGRVRSYVVNWGNRPRSQQERTPSGRLGTVEDMAGAAIFLASRAGDYVVGSTLVVDGGVKHARG